MPWAVAGAIGGALISSSASDRASDAQSGAAAASDATNRYIFDKTRADNQPLIDTRNAALGHVNALLANPAGVTNDPGYKFGLDQGTNALASHAAAGGSYFSGNTLKGLTKFGQDYAGSKLTDVMNRYSAAAGLGQAATQGNALAGANYANNQSSNARYAGDSSAYNALNQGNTWGNAFGQLGALGKRNGWGSGWPSSGPSNADLESQYGFSDERLKTDMKRIGTSERGYPVYAFKWLDGSPGISVSAQEVQARDPSAVREVDGFLQVNFSKV